MQIYELITLKTKDGLLGPVTEHEIRWAAFLPQEAIVVSDKGKCKKLNTLYAIVHDTSKISVLELLTRMYKDMPVNDVEHICNNDPLIKQFFLAFIDFPYNE